MKKIAVFLFIVFFSLSILSLSAQAPSFKWVKAFEHDSTEMGEGRSVATDLSGNVYTTGCFQGTNDFDPGPGVYNLNSVTTIDYEVYISKLDSLGNFLWAITIGDSISSYGRSIATDSSGNVYIGGSFQGTMDFDPGIGIFNLTSTGSYGNAFILKLDGSGNFLWAGNVGGGLVTDLFSIAVEPGGDVYVTGNFRDTIDCDPGTGVYSMMSDTGSVNAFVLKLNASGNFIWAKNLGGGGNTFVSIQGAVCDGLGSVLFTGQFFGTVDFNQGAGTSIVTSSSPLDADLFILKLDIAGSFVWVKIMEGAMLFGYSYAISADTAGNIYTTGWYSGTLDFDPGPGVYILTSAGTTVNANAFVLKLDSSGNFLWAKGITHSEITQGYSIRNDVLGNVYMSGCYNGLVDFDFGSGVFNLDSGDTLSYGYHGFILKLDSSGNFLWAGSVGSGPNNGSTAQGITIDKDENVYTVGIFGGFVDFDPNAGIVNLLTYGGTTYVHKMSKTATVWPGDADHNNVADNNDLLPIGVYYGYTGTPRTSFSNAWLEYSSNDWNILQTNGADVKHADCNGDGLIDLNDTLAISLNFASTHAFAPTQNEQRLSVPDFHLVIGSGPYFSGSIVNAEVWLGDSAMPVTNAYGVAFRLHYDAAVVQPWSETLTYPASWLGTPGVNSITYSKIDNVDNTAYGAETRKDHLNKSGYGKIANFTCQLQASLPANTMMYFYISAYTANDSSGSPMTFNTPVDSILINASPDEVVETVMENGIAVYPNPTNGSFSILFSETIQDGCVEIYNSIGELVLSQSIRNQNIMIDLKDQPNGLYFIKVLNDGKVHGAARILKQE